MFVGVNIWTDRESDARRFVKEKGIPYFVGRDGSDAIATAYDIQGTPTTYFIGPDGRIKAVHEGIMTEEALVKGLGVLLKR